MESCDSRRIRKVPAIETMKISLDFSRRDCFHHLQSTPRNLARQVANATLRHVFPIES